MATKTRAKILLGFTRAEQDSQDSPPTSMKFFAARPDLGAKNGNKNNKRQLWSVNLQLKLYNPLTS